MPLERREPKTRFVPARSSAPRIQEAPGDAAAATPQPRSESAHGPLRTTCSRPRQLRAPAAEPPRPGTLCSEKAEIRIPVWMPELRTLSSELPGEEQERARNLSHSLRSDADLTSARTKLPGAAPQEGHAGDVQQELTEALELHRP